VNLIGPLYYLYEWRESERVYQLLVGLAEVFVCSINWPETSVQDLKQEDENSFVLHFSLWMTYFGDVVKSISAQLCEALSGEVGE
jgi:hypothetical protein